MAAVQAAPVFLNRKATTEKACDLIAKAARNGAKLAVLPEAFIPGYPDWVWVVPNSRSDILDGLYTELIENAVAIPDKTTDLLCRTAKQSKIHVAIGVNERNAEASDASLYNHGRSLSHGQRRTDLSLGDKTLEFVYTLWVHWPETMAAARSHPDHVRFLSRRKM